MRALLLSLATFVLLATIPVQASASQSLLAVEADRGHPVTVRCADKWPAIDNIRGNRLSCHMAKRIIPPALAGGYGWPEWYCDSRIERLGRWTVFSCTTGRGSIVTAGRGTPWMKFRMLHDLV